jgi:DNA-binding Lrp family transcriptional regulator
LQALDENVRATYKQIGKYAHLGKETAQYRVKRLEEEGCISGYWTHVRRGSPLFVYKILLKNRGMSKDALEHFSKYLSEQKVVSWFASCQGYWNFLVTVSSSNDSEIAEFAHTLFTLYSKHFCDIQLLKSFSAIVFPEKYLYHKIPLRSFRDNFFQGKFSLDSKNIAILEHLSTNPRISFVDLSKKINLTPEAISLRFRKLIKQGNILFMKPRIRHERLGLSYTHLFLRFSDGEQVSPAISYLSSCRECVFVMEHIGKYQLHAELVCPPEKIANILNSFMNRFSLHIQEYDLCRIQEEFKLQLS